MCKQCTHTAALPCPACPIPNTQYPGAGVERDPVQRRVLRPARRGRARRAGGGQALHLQVPAPAAVSRGAGACAWVASALPAGGLGTARSRAEGASCTLRSEAQRPAQGPRPHTWRCTSGRRPHQTTIARASPAARRRRRALALMLRACTPRCMPAGRAPCASTSATWACPARSPRWAGFPLGFGRPGGCWGGLLPALPAGGVRASPAHPPLGGAAHVLIVTDLGLRFFFNLGHPENHPNTARSTRTPSSRPTCCRASASSATTRSRSWPSRWAPGLQWAAGLGAPPIGGTAGLGGAPPTTVVGRGEVGLGCNTVQTAAIRAGARGARGRARRGVRRAARVPPPSPPRAPGCLHRGRCTPNPCPARARPPGARLLRLLWLPRHQLLRRVLALRHPRRAQGAHRRGAPVSACTAAACWAVWLAGVGARALIDEAHR